MATSVQSYASFNHFNITSPGPWVLHVEINRPEKLNAFSEPVWRQLGEVFDQISLDPEIRAVVLSGSGEKAFTAGLDVSSASEGSVLGPNSGNWVDGPRKAKFLRSHIHEFQDAISSLERCEKPVICCMHGISIGLAIDIASAADIRLAASNTHFSVKEVDIGIAADIGTLARLPKIVGSASWIKDVCMTARRFSAQEALAQGFVSQVLEDKKATVQAGLDLAKLLAEKSPLAVQGTKELLNYGRDHTTSEALRYTAVWNSILVQGEDFGKALLSGLKKTKPTFAKL